MDKETKYLFHMGLLEFGSTMPRVWHDAVWPHWIVCPVVVFLALVTKSALSWILHVYLLVPWPLWCLDHLARVIMLLHFFWMRFVVPEFLPWTTIWASNLRKMKTWSSTWEHWKRIQIWVMMSLMVGKVLTHHSVSVKAFKNVMHDIWQSRNCVEICHVGMNLFS